MTIALAKDVEAFLQDQVRAGVSADASDLVNDVLRSLREQQKRPFAVTPLTASDFDGIRERVQALLKRTAA